jgi:hypothetical protein
MTGHKKKTKAIKCVKITTDKIKTGHKNNTKAIKTV